MIQALLALAFVAIPQAPHELERATGWRALFDGETTAGWVGHGREAFPAAGWDVVDGCLHKVPGASGGDVVADELFTDFELEFEWRVAPGANSGMKYRVPPADSPRAMLGPEYQVLDDAAHPGEAEMHKTGGLYALYAPAGAELRPVGEFNTSRVIARGDHIEHWLNGTRVVDCEVGSDDWNARQAASKFKSAEGFAAPRPGRIGFQDHGGEVWYRNVRVRALPAPGAAIELFTDGTLDGWKEVGDAKWTPIEGGVLGEIGGGGQSFLVTEREVGDFVLEMELMPELPGNSGVQVRSHQRENGRVFGYQIEIDSSKRAWSGGLYDEARRGWLDDLTEEPAARAAFVLGGWNTYRIECVGPWIRTWVNGVPAADAFDPLDLSGSIGLQVHSGNNTKVHWRDVRLWDLGTRAWEPLPTAESGLQVPAALGDFALRLHFEGENAAPSVAFRVGEQEPVLGGDEGLHAEALGWVFAAPPVEGRERGTITICAFGDRAAVHLDGKRLADLRAPDARRAGRVVLGSSVTWTSAELLGEAR